MMRMSMTAAATAIMSSRERSTVGKHLDASRPSHRPEQVSIEVTLAGGYSNDKADSSGSVDGAKRDRVPALIRMTSGEVNPGEDPRLLGLHSRAVKPMAN